jgi:hypothetical protein
MASAGACWTTPSTVSAVGERVSIAAEMTELSDEEGLDFEELLESVGTVFSP